MRALALVGLVALACVPAFAQSKRYPLPPVDKDREDAAKSALWDKAINPAKKPYENLTDEARQLIEARNVESLKSAIPKLDEAIKLMPDEPKAYRLRGEAAMRLAQWPQCAADLEAADARTKHADDSDAARRLRVEQLRDLGLCQARAGKLAEAERSLADAAASGASYGEVWMRLGEVRIAMGKLDEAEAALKASLETPDSAAALVHWLLAATYDRARQPGEASVEAGLAYVNDKGLSTLVTPTLPLLGVDEADYLLGLAYTATDPAKPENSLVYFKRYLRLAVDSPWRKRAEEHVRELKAAELPETVLRMRGNAPLDVMVARTAVRRSMPAMRACLAKLPSTTFVVTLTKTGPHAPSPDRPHMTTPPHDGTYVDVALNLEDSPIADQDAARRCLDGLVRAIPMPLPKERETYYVASFLVAPP